uniref:Uncharacterized protein n=1 Tax=Plectus sambesii TaxID=2011161 RepID=A0A914V2E2_9BILA
ERFKKKDKTAPEPPPKDFAPVDSDYDEINDDRRPHAYQQHDHRHVEPADNWSNDYDDVNSVHGQHNEAYDDADDIRRHQRHR